ncbi:collagen alpha-1(I) chain-like [Varroa destructor]|nr:collagen alpha-1(I) chain-like [Varroa destructor]
MDGILRNGDVTGRSMQNRTPLKNGAPSVAPPGVAAQSSLYPEKAPSRERDRDSSRNIKEELPGMVAAADLKSSASKGAPEDFAASLHKAATGHASGVGPYGLPAPPPGLAGLPTPGLMWPHGHAHPSALPPAEYQRMIASDAMLSERYRAMFAMVPPGGTTGLSPADRMRLGPASNEELEKQLSYERNFSEHIERNKLLGAQAAAGLPGAPPGFLGGPSPAGHAPPPGHPYLSSLGPLGHGGPPSAGLTSLRGKGGSVGPSIPGGPMSAMGLAMAGGVPTHPGVPPPPLIPAGGPGASHPMHKTLSSMIPSASDKPLR